MCILCRGCDSRELFHGLAISEDAFFEEHLNKYDVIYLDITWFISFAANKKDIVRTLQEKVIDELRGAYPNAKQENTLSETLAAINEMNGNRFIFIIDEWDALFREAKEDTDLQDEYILLLRGLFKNSGFTDKTIEAAYMTGILPIKNNKEESLRSTIHCAYLACGEEFIRFDEFGVGGRIRKTVQGWSGGGLASS